MSEDQLKSFLEAVKADAGLQEKLNAAADADAVVAIAKESGFMISVEELEMSKELTEDEELERVAGGGRYMENYKKTIKGCL
jgi:predicted ribosomally synthesized peptide with nif11-like leader